MKRWPRAITFAVGLLLLASSIPADAQSTGAASKVGYFGWPDEPEASPLRAAFMRGLRDLGYSPGQNIVVDVRRWTTEAQLRQSLGEFARRRPDVIFVGPPSAALAAKQLTKDIPIVCGSCGDPVENGLASSLARPGGQVTGIASLSAELIGKRVELMKELLPGLSRVAVFVFPANPGTRPTLRTLDEAGRKLGISMRLVEIRSAGDFDGAFRSAAADGAGAVVLQDDPLLRSAQTQIAQLARKHRLPVSSGVLEIAEAGGLIAYGPDRVDMCRRSSGFVDKILKGARPAELPFEQVAKLELVVNLKTAKALGLSIPPPFLLRADRVIE